MKKMTKERKNAAAAAYRFYTMTQEATDSVEAYNYREKMYTMMEVIGLNNYEKQAGLSESFEYIYKDAEEKRSWDAWPPLKHWNHVEQVEQANVLNAARFWLNW